MRKTQWFAIAAGLLLFGGPACSGQTETSGDSTGSGMDAGTGANSGSGSGGSNGSSDGTTATDNGGESGGTGGTTSASCPSVEPASNTSCSDQGEICTYINCVAPDYRDDHVMMCLNGTWTLNSQITCDGQPTSCPRTAPVRGESCDASATPGPCTSVDVCGIAQLAYCTDGLWEFGSSDDADRIAPVDTGSATVGTATATSTTGSAPPPPTCPANVPTLGSACCPANYPPVCDYTAGSGTGAGFAAPAPGVGGAGSSTVSSSTVSGDSSSATGSGGSPGAGGSGSGIVLIVECVTCSANMVWELSDACL